MKMSFLKTFCSSLLFSTIAFSAQAHNYYPNLPSYQSPAFESHSNEGHYASYYEDQTYRYRLHNHAFHHFISWTDNAEVLFHDSSRWAIEPNERYTVSTWVKDDEILVRPCTAWFSSYKYVLFNCTTQQSIRANLINPGAYTLYITKINEYDRLIQLSDNSVWTIDISNPTFANWQNGQRVVVGVSSNWHYETNPEILINADLYNQPYCLVNHLGVGL
jgi:hypothetical protein